jgi:hypothetical protein
LEQFKEEMGGNVLLKEGTGRFLPTDADKVVTFIRHYKATWRNPSTVLRELEITRTAVQKILHPRFKLPGNKLKKAEGGREEGS